MSPISPLSILALAGAAVAVPYHGHRHHHHPGGYGSAMPSGAPSGSFPVGPVGGTGTGAPYPYATANGTGLYPTGSGIPTGYGSGIPTNYGPSPVGPATDSSATNNAYAASSSDTCTSDVTVTSKLQVTVTVTTADESSSSAVEVSPVAGSSYSQSHSRRKSTINITRTVHKGAPIHSYTAPTSSSSEAAPVSGSSSSRGRSTINVTRTVTAPGSSSSAYSAPSSSSEAAPIESSAPVYSYGSIPLTYSTEVESTSSSEAAPVETSSSAVYTSPVYSASSSSSSSEAAPVETSSSVAYTSSVYSAPSSSSSSEAAPVETSSSAIYAAPTLTYSSAGKGVTYATSANSAAPAATSASSSGKGKRGLAYNDASLTECFLDSNHVSWAYNWASSTSGLSSSLSYIPLLWGPTSGFTGSWTDNADAAIKAGSTHLFGFNEPDMSSQSNLSPEAAADAWRTYMEPYAGKAKLVAPSVTNGGGSMGLTWMSNFLAACSDCTIDAVNIHWYDSASNPGYFKSHVQNATDVAGGKPVFLTEFGASGSDDQISTFLEDVMPWMDGQDFVQGYAYFMVSDGLLNSGSGASSYGQTYMSYSG